MDTQIQNELDNSIKLFFWDPRDGCDNYRIEYPKYNHKQFLKDNRIVRYPRLLLIRRDLYFTLWKPLNQTQLLPDQPYDGIPHFASILLIRSACELLIRGLFSRNFDSPKDKDYNDFFRKYFNLNQDESKALKFLRDSIVHDGYSLSVYKNENSANIKYYFDITQNGSNPIYQNNNWDPGYNSIKYIVNPWILHDRFENALIKIKGELLEIDGVILRGYYQANLSNRNNWVLID